MEEEKRDWIEYIGDGLVRIGFFMGVPVIIATDYISRALDLWVKGANRSYEEYKAQKAMKTYREDKQQ